jgi:acetyltransferase-like isoleucine patch superfamily enzyme
LTRCIHVCLGELAVVLDGVHNRNGCVIGAGAVLTNSMPSFSIAAGVPAKINSKRGQLREPQAHMHAECEISTMASEIPKNEW